MRSLKRVCVLVSRFACATYTWNSTKRVGMPSHMHGYAYETCIRHVSGIIKMICIMNVFRFKYSVSERVACFRVSLVAAVAAATCVAAGSVRS